MKKANGRITPIYLSMHDQQRRHLASATNADRLVDLRVRTLPQPRGILSDYYHSKLRYLSWAGVICPPVFEICPPSKYRIALHPHNLTLAKLQVGF